MWSTFAERIVERLDDGDDQRLWQAAVEEVYVEAAFLCCQARRSREVFTELGRCSHWLSPHNAGSWLPDARYAWPSGYGGSGWNIFGLPLLDWSLLWSWCPNSEAWVPTERVQGKRPLTLRVAIPSRTARHERAVVHALWAPGTPTMPGKRLLQAYGFMKTDDVWKCTSTYGAAEPYEATGRIESQDGANLAADGEDVPRRETQTEGT
jgi:hypothetical protein